MIDPNTWQTILARADRPTEKAAAFCRAICPMDLADVPLYILERRDIPENHRIAEDVAGGWTSEVLDIQLRDTLLANGQWQGRGIAIVIKERPQLTADEAARFYSII